ncbi:uncharacterized protein LOC126678694 [Mercurialis annua]|uniref:uncharacterized protein LOC126678694 n=1 Tax=Mercurialis annua TaxID=3986 RepID=UPI002160BEEB|nr:uncharacterized protein LOC126678694 [Mercurialis annua]
MAASFKLGEELRFQQRWDFRRGDSDFDTSSYDSRSSLGGEQADIRSRLALVPVQNDETRDTTKFQQKGKSDPGVSVQTELGKAEKGKRGRKGKNVNSEQKRGVRKVADRKKGMSIIDENAALNDLKNYMNSLLEEVKVTRTNLLSWMKEEMEKLMEEEEKACETEKKRHEDRIKHQNKSQDSQAYVQHQSLFGQNIPLQHQNNLELHQPENKSRKNIRAQRGRRTGASTTARSKKLDKVDYSQAIVILTQSEDDREQKSVLSDKRNSKSGPSNPKTPEKSIVLGIKAQNSSNGSPVKSARGKRVASSDNHCQVIGSIASGLTTDLNFSSESFNQMPSSMYLTLPTVLSHPYTTNHTSESSNTRSFSYVQPRIYQNQAERSNPTTGSSNYLGYYQSLLQPEERSRHFAQIASDTSFFNHNSTSTSSLIGHGFTVPLQAVNGGFNIPRQFDLESIPRENSNILGLPMNGGGAIRFSAGDYYSLPESYVANNLHNHSNYRADGRQIAYQETCRYPK